MELYCLRYVLIATPCVGSSVLTLCVRSNSKSPGPVQGMLLHFPRKALQLLQNQLQLHTSLPSSFVCRWWVCLNWGVGVLAPLDLPFGM